MNYKNGQQSNLNKASEVTVSYGGGILSSLPVYFFASWPRLWATWATWGHEPNAVHWWHLITHHSTRQMLLNVGVNKWANNKATLTLL